MEDLQGGTLALEHRYDLNAREGRVAQAVLYKAVQHPFEQPVWVRVYESLDADELDSSIEARLKESAHAASALDERTNGVLRVVDYGELRPRVPFVVTERVEGPCLFDWLESEGTLDLASVVELVDRSAKILESAHSLGVIHGSLGGHSIWIPDRDLSRLRMGGFGLGFTMHELRQMSSALLDYHSVAPLAPELFSEDACPDVRSDVYSLAALAYTALAGSHPYFEDVTDISEGLVKIVSGEFRSLTEFGVSDDVVSIIERGLESDPEDRWSSVAEFRRELERATRQDSQSGDSLEGAWDQEFDELEERDYETTETGLSPTPSGTLVGFMVFALVISNLGWIFFRVDESRATVNEEVPPVEREVLVSRIELKSEPAGAKVFRVVSEGSEELGETPMLIDASVGDGDLRLRLENPGYRSAQIRVQEHEEGQDFIVVMDPTGADEE